MILISDTVQIELIRAMGGFVLGIPSLIAAWFAYHANSTAKRVEQQTNGMTEKLVSLASKSSAQTGNLEGRAELIHEQQVAQDIQGKK